MTNTERGISGDAQALMAFESNKKSAGLAYVLWFFVGSFGAHRFYLGTVGSAVIQLVMGILGWLTIWVGFGLLLLVPLGIWLFIDLFLIPGIASDHNTKLMKSLSAAPSERPKSMPEELAQFAALRDQGAITTEEYDEQKKRILGTPTP